MKRLILALSLILSLLLLPLSVFAQGKSTTAAPGSTHSGRMQGSGMSGDKGTGCQDMKAMHEKMSSKMSDMDKRLDEKLSAMNEASGDKKMSAMSDVINEMAAQRKEMREEFRDMHAARMNCMKMEKHARWHSPGMKHGSGMEKGESNPS
jgi:hypothetical protein